MVRPRNVAAWCLIGLGAFAGCRVGYDEIFAIEQNAGGDGGTRASGGSSGSSGTDNAESGAGGAGVDATGGNSDSGGSGGSTLSGGSSTIGGEGGATEIGGSGTAGDSAGGTSGTNGGTSGTSGAATSGGNGESGEGGTGEAGMNGVSGGSGAGGDGGSGTGGVLGSGGFAGAASLGDCQTNTFDAHDYVFCDVNVAWAVARDNCASIGMLLVRIDDTDESQWVYDNVYDSPPRQGVWIGASDLAQEGEWRWADGTLFWLGDSSGSAQNGLFSAWYATQPSGQEPRDCAALDGNTLGWYDLDCMIPQPYACEAP